MKNLISKFLKLQAIGIALLIIIQAAYFDLTLFREGLEMHDKVIGFTAIIELFGLFSIPFLLRMINVRFYYIIYQFIIAASIVGMGIEFMSNETWNLPTKALMLFFIAVPLIFRRFIRKVMEEEKQNKTAIKVWMVLGTIISILILAWPLLEL